MRKIKFYNKTLIIGLLASTFSLIFKEFVHLPDILIGLLTGIGLGLEIYGALMLLKLRKSKAL
jgi:hypothetical protein